MKIRFWFLTISLLFLIGYSSSAQIRTVTGKVFDELTGSPLAGVTIVSKDSKGIIAGTQTDANGAFSLKLSPGHEKITASFIGMESVTVPVGNSTNFNINLKSTAKELDNIVVTALGINREEKSLNYSRQGVDAERLSEMQSGSFVASLAGKIAGVEVTPPGVNNASGRIVIRGNKSLTENTQPLYVIDGMIIENDPGDTNVAVSGAGALDYGNPAADINPNDIENIEVLKGPNAAALYGSRAAQGVILITTKRASSFDKVRVQYNGNFQFETITQWPQYQNGWGTGENSYKLGSATTLPNQTDDAIPNLSLLAAGSKRRSWGAPLWGQEIIGFDGELTRALPQTENAKDFYDVASRINNTVSIDGGSRKNNYRISYTNSYSNSVVHGINENLKHVLNVRLYNELTKWATLDTKITYTRDKVENRQYMNGSDRNPIYAFSTLPRDLSIKVLKKYKNDKGEETIPIGERGYNPYWNIYENTNEDTRSRINGSMSLDLKFTSYLSFKGTFGMDTYSWTGTEFNNLGAMRDPKGSMNNWNTDYTALNMDGRMLFNKSFFQNLSVTAMVGVNWYDRQREKRTQTAPELLMPGFENISNNGTYPTVGQNKYHKRTSSFYTSLSLGYKGYAFLDGTYRLDASSTLPKHNNQYSYYSVGGALIFTDAFKIASNVFSFGKLRASYAIAGTDTEPYRINQAFQLSGIYNGEPLQIISSTLNNKDLKPEMTRSVEIGVDLRFLQSRLGVDVTYYNSLSYNLISRAELPMSSGYRNRYVNTGKIRNWGWEVVLSGTPVSKKNFSWDMTINWATNDSKVLKVMPGNDNLVLNSWHNRINIMLEEGQPYGVMRGRAWKRDEQGRRLVDSTGKPIATESGAYLGNAIPDWSGSIRNTFKIYGFDVNILIDARWGGKMFSGTYRRATIAGVWENTYHGREDWYRSSVIYGENTENLTGGVLIKDAYFEDGTPSNKYLNPKDLTHSNIEEMQCFDASFVKLREVSVGYNLPRRLLRKLPFSNIRVSFVGRNLWIIHQKTPKGIDPEASTTSGNGQGIEYGSIPPVSAFGFDIRLSF